MGKIPCYGARVPVDSTHLEYDANANCVGLDSGFWFAGSGFLILYSVSSLGPAPEFCHRFASRFFPTFFLRMFARSFVSLGLLARCAARSLRASHEFKKRSV